VDTSRYTPRRIARAIGHRLYAPPKFSVVLRRDLERTMDLPEAKIPISIRPARDADAPRILDLLAELSGSERATRERFLRSNIGTCHLAVTDSDEITYMQWLVGPEDNHLLRAHTNLPILQDGEALLENAYTPASFRGKGIMSSAMAQIAERARDLGARWVLTVVEQDNVPSLKGCHRAGFESYMIKTDRWRLMRHQIRYSTLPPDWRNDRAESPR
jgi:RimJ/RimL family protein N-acetyltransferase